MSELVERVAAEIAMCNLSEHKARAAIAAVFDWMGEPSADALSFGTYSLEGCEEDREPCDRRTKARHTFETMLSTMRREALGDQL